jgi:hypothetical protein
VVLRKRDLVRQGGEPSAERRIGKNCPKQPRVSADKEAYVSFNEAKENPRYTW